MLSGGERQRLALARIILRQPRILILDEFTSALDSQTERELLEAMEEALSGTTLIVISHRISTALWADRILMLDQGRRIEEVSSSWLLKNRERPENFAEGQLLAEAPANGGGRTLTQII
jgi:ATP-binding cassette subfamily B protein